MQRCHDKNGKSYAQYGGAGVTVCERWQSFPEFLADMGECPDRSMTLDRIKGEIGYQPGNCRWATHTEQNRNRPGHCVMLTHGGKTMLMTDWAKETGMQFDTLRARIRLGWSVERALSAPIKPHGVRPTRKAA